MKEKYVNEIDVLLESCRAHMNLLIGELKVGVDDWAEEQLRRLENDILRIREAFERGVKEMRSEKKEK